jgi:hypothetical protein
MVASRLANLYPERFTGFAFLALGYYPPSPSFDVVSANARAKAKFGYVRLSPLSLAGLNQRGIDFQEMLGYWIFNSASNATELLETHWGSFLALAFPANPALWRHHMGPTGAFEQWLCDDRQGPRPRYLDEQALATISSNLRAGGISAPLLWYKVRTSGLATIDEKRTCAILCAEVCSTHTTTCCQRYRRVLIRSPSPCLWALHVTIRSVLQTHKRHKPQNTVPTGASGGTMGTTGSSFHTETSSGAT